VADLTTLSDEDLKAIADGKMDSLSDEALKLIASDQSAPAKAEARPSEDEIPRPDKGPFANDPIGYQGYVMASPAGKKQMGRVAQGIKNMGLEAGGATAGQIIGAPFEEVGGSHILGAIGGALGNTVAQLTTPGKRFSFGEALGAGATGAIPGASLAKAPLKEVAKYGAKQAIGNVARENIQSFVDTGRAAPLERDAISAATGLLSSPAGKFLDSGKMAAAVKQASGNDSVRRETLRLGRELGLVVPPPAINPNPVNDTLNSIAGKAATAQSAILRNAPKIDDAIRAEIGLSPGTPFSPIALNTARVPHNLVYDQIGQSSPAAKNLLEQFKQTTADANELYAAYRLSPIKDPAILKQAKALDAQAAIYKTNLGKVVGPTLMKQFDSARTALAKIGLAERSVNPGTGSIDPNVIGKALDAGEFMSGNFTKIGRFQNAFGKYVKDASTTPPAGVDYLKTLAKIGVGGYGVKTGDVGAAIAGVAAMEGAERGTRNLILSKAYQEKLANPSYGAAQADVPAQLAARSVARIADEDTPLTDEEKARLAALEAQYGPATAP